MILSNSISFAPRFWWIFRLFVIILCCACLPEAAESQYTPPERFEFKIRINFTQGAERKPVQFERIKGLIVFRARVQGKDVWAILDNLSDGSLLDSGFARAVGLPMSAPIGPLRTQNGALERRWIDAVDVAIPGQISMATRLSATDLAFFKRATGRDISLIVGKELFDSLAFIIYHDDRFEIVLSGSIKVSPGVEAIELGQAQGKPLIPVKIDGADAALALDLGYNGEVTLSDAAWLRTGITGTSSRSILVGQTDGLLKLHQATVVRRLSLGSITLSNVEITRGLSTEGEGADGLLGMTILSQFTVAIDVKARKLWLLPPPSPGVGKPKR